MHLRGAPEGVLADTRGSCSTHPMRRDIDDGAKLHNARAPHSQPCGHVCERAQSLPIRINSS